MSWKPSVGEVMTITKKVVIGSDIDAAVYTIELFSGLFLDVTRPETTKRDLRCLKVATAYQAAWEVDQPDLVTRSAVKSLDQDGSSVNFAPDGQVLAPFAALWIKRLSFKGTRSVRIQGVTERVIRDSDDALPWKPL